MPSDPASPVPSPDGAVLSTRERTILPRIVPCLIIERGRLVKTTRFKAPRYIGDPLNAVRIFNEKEVDELVFLDILASRERREPDLDLIKQIAAECFMPFAYGGGIRTLDQVRRILTGGAEKIVLNSVAIEAPDIIRAASAEFGSQSVVVGIDVKRDLFRRPRVFLASRDRRVGIDPVDHARAMVSAGAGEIFLNDVDRDGTRTGFDLDLIGRVAAAVEVPVMPCGGADSLHDLARAIAVGASAVAASSLFVLHGKHRAVLITYPSRPELTDVF